MASNISAFYSILPTAILVLWTLVKVALTCLAIVTFIYVLKIYKMLKQKENEENNHPNVNCNSNLNTNQ